MATVEAATPSTSECTLHKAEMCFLKLFHSMPICDESEVSFRCHHYKVLDACFRETDTVCSPSVIGHTAKAAYRRTLIACARHSGKRYRNAPRRGKTSPTIRRQSPPSEIQFISLFGYLQTQCNTKPHENCTNSEYTEMVTHCETDIREKSHLANSDLDRHQLLRVKLDASSRLLQYAETRRDDECLMVRSALTDIFQIHQKYCFQTIVTKCMCSRLNFENLCAVNCTGLEANSLPFDQRVSWDEFRGRLTGSGARGPHLNPHSMLILALWLMKLLMKAIC
ncbi:Protein R01E6.7 [Aphelenchoides avenae]|nr:Protein R01E6.7 [Aphelenchus avenae]